MTLWIGRGFGAPMKFIGRQGLEGPPTKVMLLWLGAYICNWLTIWLAGWLSGYISMSRRRVPTSFTQCLLLPPLQLPCQKDQPGYRCFDS